MSRQENIVQAQIEGTRRVESLVNHAFKAFHGDQVEVNTFLTSAIDTPDSKTRKLTPLEMSELSSDGYDRALFTLYAQTGARPS